MASPRGDEGDAMEPNRLYEAEVNKQILEVRRDDAFNPDISAKAFRLHILLRFLATKDGWRFYETGLAKIMGISLRVLARLVKELKAGGYLTINRFRDIKTGQFSGWTWTVYPTTIQRCIRLKLLPVVKFSPDPAKPPKCQKTVIR